MEFVVCGDLHLQCKLLARVLPDHDVIGMHLNTVKNILDYCSKHKIKHMVITGDIFDTPYAEQLTIQRILQLLINYPHINIHMYNGNHDYANRNNISLMFFKYIVGIAGLTHIKIYLKPTKTYWGNIPVYFAPWPHFKGPNTPSLCFGHFTINGTKGNNNFTLSSSITKKALGKENYWIIGDLHTFQYSKGVLYPGMPYMIRFDDSEDKGFIHASVYSPLKVEWERKILKQPYKLKTKDIKSLRDIENLSESTFYKVIHSSDVTLPNDIMMKHPNIVEMPRAYRNTIEHNSLILGKINSTVNEVGEFDLIENLENFLTAYGLDKDLITKSKKTAVSLIKSIISR